MFALVVAAALPWFSPPTTAVSTQSVTFANAGAALHGTLYLPASKGPVPAIVVFHGASEPLASTPLYRHLSQGLPQLGIAVLLFDRRGTGQSTGDKDVPYETLADDGIAGARALRALSQIDPKRVGYWGISQGGWLATFAAIRDPQAAFAVAVSAPLTTPEVQMEFADSNRLEALGYGQTDVAGMMYARKMWTGYLRGTNSYDAAAAAIAKIEKKPWFNLMYIPTAEALTKDPQKSSWRTQMDDDPMAAVEQVKIPMLFVLGSQDPWIPVRTTAAKLADVTTTHPWIAYTVVPDANHLMMFPPGRETMSDADPAAVASERPESPAYFMLLANWLETTLHRVAPPI